MDSKKLLGIGAGVIGAVCLFFSNYIAEQLVEGRLQIRKGQQTVDTVNSVFSATKYTAPVGKTLTKSGQRKIDAGQAQIDRYETISERLKVGGIILIVLGAGIFFFWKRKR